MKEFSVTREFEVNAYEAIVDVFGPRSQVIVAIEELSELIKELTKYIRQDGNRDNLIEEVADVQIMLEQLRYIFSITPEEIKEKRKEKLDRIKPVVTERLMSHATKRYEAASLKVGELP